MIAPRTNFPPRKSSVIVALNDDTCQNIVSRYFQQRGWNVHLVYSNEQLHKMSTRQSPQLVVLDTEWPLESGWLACKKMTSVRDDLPVYLISPKAGPKEMAFGEMVGAAAVTSYGLFTIQLESLLEECPTVEVA